MATQKRSTYKKSSAKRPARKAPKRTATTKTATKGAKKTAGTKKQIKGLSIHNVEKEVKKLPGWELNKAQTTITKSFNMTSYIAGVAFIARIAVNAEVLNHHPDIELSYGKVKVKLTTHKTGTLTKLDLALAKRIDSIKMKER